MSQALSIDTDISGKIVIITGGSSGIGREAAAALAGRGAQVVLAVRSESAGHAAVAHIRQQHPHAAVELGPRLDLADVDSIRAFAHAFRAQQRPLHVLINNAGANYVSDALTPAGVPILTQVNYLGPFLLTRLLEPCLVASAPSRVVNVSSVTHRYGRLDNPARFLSRSAAGVGGKYPATKLANVLHANELQRRLGPRGVAACAVDPGSVATNIYRDSLLFSRQPLKWLISTFYAPPWDGAAAVVHAACAPWKRPDRAAGRGPIGRRGYVRQDGLQRADGDTWFFARGVFAWPTITGYRGQRPGLLGALRTHAWAARALALSGLDWPLRRLGNGRWMAQPLAVPAAPASDNADLAKALWDLSADKCGLPREVCVQQQQ